MPRKPQLAGFLTRLLTNPSGAIATTLPKVLSKRWAEAGVLSQIAMELSKSTQGGPVHIDDKAAAAFMETLKKQGWGIFAVMGLQGQGKTVFSAYCAYLFGREHKYVLGVQPDQEEALVRNGGFEKLSSFSQVTTLPANSFVILDDLAKYLNQRTYFQDDGKLLNELVTDLRHKRITVFGTGQNTGAINRHFFDTAETIFWKSPPISADLERPAFRRIVQQAMGLFHGRPESWQQRSVYVYSARYIGLYQYQAGDVVRALGL